MDNGFPEEQPEEDNDDESPPIEREREAEYIRVETLYKDQRRELMAKMVAIESAATEERAPAQTNAQEVKSIMQSRK